MADVTALDIVIDTGKANASLNNLQKEFAATGKAAQNSAKSLDRFGDETKKAKSPVDSLDRSVGSFADTIRSSIAPVTSLIASIGAITAIKRSVQTYASFETQLARIRVVSQATVGEMERLKTIASDLGATTAFSQDQVAQGLLNLARAGKSVEEQINLIKPAMDLAQAGTIGMGDAASALTTSMSQFSLGASEGVRIANLFTAAANSADQTVEEFSAAMVRGAGAIAGVGRSIEEAALITSSLAEVGTTGERASTALRGYARELATLNDPSAEQAAILKRIAGGFNALNPVTNDYISVIRTLEQANLSYTDVLTLLGNEAGPVFAQVINKGADAVENLNQKIAGAAPAADAAKQNLGELETSFKNLQSATEGAFSAIGEQIAGPVNTSVQVLTALLLDLKSVVGATVVERIADTKDEIKELQDEFLQLQNTANKSAGEKLLTTDFWQNLGTNLLGNANARIGEIAGRIDELNKELKELTEINAELDKQKKAAAGGGGTGGAGGAGTATGGAGGGIPPEFQESVAQAIENLKALAEQEEEATRFQKASNEALATAARLAEERNAAEEEAKAAEADRKRVADRLSGAYGLQAQAAENLAQMFDLTSDAADGLISQLKSGVASAGPNASRGVAVGEAFLTGGPIAAILELVLSNQRIQETIDRLFGQILDKLDRVIDPFADVLDSFLDISEAMMNVADILSGFDLIVGALEEVARAIGSLADGIVGEINKAGQGAGNIITNLTGGAGLGGQAGDAITGIFGGTTKSQQKEVDRQLRGEVDAFLMNFYDGLEDESVQRQKRVQRAFDDEISSIKKSDASQKTRDRLKVAVREANAVALAAEGFFNAAIDMANQAATTAGASADSFQKTMVEIREAQEKFAEEVIAPAREVIETAFLSDLEKELRSITKGYDEQRKALEDLEPAVRREKEAVIAQAESFERSQAVQRDQIRVNEELKRSAEEAAEALRQQIEANKQAIDDIGKALGLVKFEATGDISGFFESIFPQIDSITGDTGEVLLNFRDQFKKFGIDLKDVTQEQFAILNNYSSNITEFAELLEEASKKTDAAGQLIFPPDVIDSFFEGFVEDSTKAATEAFDKLNQTAEKSFPQIDKLVEKFEFFASPDALAGLNEFDADLVDPALIDRIKETKFQFSQLREEFIEAIVAERDAVKANQIANTLRAEEAKVIDSLNAQIDQAVESRQKETAEIEDSLNAFKFNIISSELSSLGKSILDINRRYSNFVKSSMDATGDLALSADQLADLAKSRSSEITKAIDSAFKPFLDNISRFRNTLNQFRGDLVGAPAVTIEDLVAKVQILQNLGDEGILNESELRDRQALMQQILEQAKEIDAQQTLTNANYQRAVNKAAELVQGINTQISELLLSGFNVAGPQAKFDEAEKQFEELRGKALDAAKSADESDDFAITAFREFAENFLQASQDLFKSGQGHVDNFNKTITALQELEQAASEQTAEGIQSTEQSTKEVIQSIVASLDEVALTLESKVSEAAAKLIDINIQFGGENIEDVGGIPVYTSDFEVAVDVMRKVDGNLVEGTVGNTIFEIIADIDRIAIGGHVSGDVATASYQLVADITRAINDPSGTQILNGNTATSSYELFADISRDTNDIEKNFDKDTLLTKLKMFGQVVKQVNGDTVEGTDAKNQLLNMLGTVRRFVTVGNTTDEITSPDGMKTIPLNITSDFVATVNGQQVGLSGLSGTITFDISAQLETGFSNLNGSISGLALGLGNLLRERFGRIETGMVKSVQADLAIGQSLFDGITRRLDKINDSIVAGGNGTSSLPLGFLLDTNGIFKNSIATKERLQTIATNTGGIAIGNVVRLNRIADIMEDVKNRIGEVKIANDHVRGAVDGQTSRLDGKLNEVKMAVEDVRRKFALGGPVIGPSHGAGGVPIEAEGGEYIFSRRDVSRLGIPFLESLRSGETTPDSMSFQNGGLVPTITRSSDTRITNTLLMSMNSKLNRLTEVLLEKDLNVEINVDTDEMVDAKISSNNERIQNNLNRRNLEPVARAF